MASSWSFRGRSLLLAASLALAQAPAPEREFQEALGHFGGARFEVAERTLRRVVEQRPRWFEARFLLGASLAAQRRAEAAVAELAAAQRLNPWHLDCRKLLAAEYLGLERAGEAYALLRPLLAGRQADEEILLLAVEALHVRNDAGDAGEAWKLSERGIARFPRSARMLSWRGYALRENGDFDGARKSLEAALALAPEDAAAQVLLADVARRQGAHREAREGFELALRLSPGDEEAVVGLSRTLAAMGRLEEALLVTQQAVEASPGAARLRLELSQLYARTGDAESAALQASEFERLGGGQRDPAIPTRLRAISIR